MQRRAASPSALAFAFVLAIVAIVLGAPRPAFAQRVHVCSAKGEVWSYTERACVPPKPAPKLSPQEKLNEATADVFQTGKHPDVKRGLATLEQTCAASYGPACTVLGSVYANGQVIARDADKAMAAYVKACAAHDLEGCLEVGLLAYEIRHFPDARVAFIHACDLASGVACVRGAEMIERGLGGDADAATAAPMYKKAFDLLGARCPGHGPACEIVGYLYEHGKGVAADPARAVASYRSGCDVSSGAACERLAAALDAGLAGPADAVAANAAYVKACDADIAHACTTLSQREKDPTRAVELARRGCQLSAGLCGVLGLDDESGLAAAAPNLAASNTHFRTACDAGNLAACARLGRHAHAGAGMPVDTALAIKLEDLACQGGEGEACAMAAEFVSAADLPRARGYAKTGCDGGNADSCFLVGLYLTRIDPPDQAAAYALYERACTAGVAPACFAAANDLDRGVGVAANSAEALAHYQRACKQDAPISGEACVYVVNRSYTATPHDLPGAMDASARACVNGKLDPCAWVAQIAPDVAGDHHDVRDYLAAACRRNIDSACFGEAELLQGGTELDKRAALELLRTSCDQHKNDHACTALAGALYYGVGTLPQKETGEQMFDELCKRDVGNACEQMSIFDNLRGTYDQAIVYAQRACDDDSPEGCSSLGYYYFTAKGTRWDHAKAITLWQKACELGGVYGCLNMGYMYNYGIGVPRDLAKAYAAYAKSCNPLDSIACRGVAQFFATGEGGVKQDLKKAEANYRESCEGRQPAPDGCSDLATFLEHQHRGTPSEIAALRQKAFDLATERAKDNPLSMYILGTYYRDGIATVKDLATARAWFAKGCDGYDPLACMAAGKEFLATGVPADRALAQQEYLARACAVGLAEACTLKDAPAPAPTTTPGANLHAQGCGCSGAPDAGGSALMFGVVALVCRRRSRYR